MIPQWLSDWLATISGLELVLWLGGIVAVIAWLWKTTPWKGIVAFARAIVQGAQILDSVKDLPRFIEKTEKQLDSIYHETHFNNGSSIKDAVVRTEKIVNELKDESAAQTGALGVVQKQIGDLHEADAALRRDFEDTLNPLEDK